MHRIVEPELMDNIENVIAFSTAERSSGRAFFVERFTNKFSNFKKGSLIDLCCGPADYDVELLKAIPDISITAVDGSDAMLDIALKNVVPGISLQKKTIPFLVNEKYDAVVSTYSLHHFHNPNMLWGTIKNLANGIIFVTDLIRPDNINEAKLIVEQYSSNDPKVFKEDFFNSLCSAFTETEIKEQLVTAGLENLSVELITGRFNTLKTIIIYGEYYGVD
jgi:ubiquinone/menaquinone biosynthesis C-methylase UbiE